ncbi:MAG: hypothetical protein Tp158DCM1229571_79 [Prokaryotic dsDNA virus sp.]|nr:MAG: hypothetical protein Tp158DCM1229571_79 [Prokaryotic dsDNA virus sp.]
MTKPIAQISFVVDVEIEYDPFEGRTPEQFSEIVHDDLIDSLWEMRNGTVHSLLTDVKSIQVIGE